MAPDDEQPKAAPPTNGRALIHALRNHLATVKIAVQTLAAFETLSERGRRRVDLAQKETEKIDPLLDALTALFEPEDGR